MDRKKALKYLKQNIILIFLIIAFLYMFFVYIFGGSKEDKLCGRHENQSVCFCDCGLKEIDLQLTEKRIEKENKYLSIQQKVWTQSINSFDQRKTFGKDTTTKQCSVSGSYEIGSELLCLDIQ